MAEQFETAALAKAAKIADLAIMGFGATDEPTQSEIKKRYFSIAAGAYRKEDSPLHFLQPRAHPDKEGTEEGFKELGAAYERLIDPKTHYQVEGAPSVVPVSRGEITARDELVRLQEQIESAWRSYTPAVATPAEASGALVVPGVHRNFDAIAGLLNQYQSKARRYATTYHKPVTELNDFLHGNLICNEMAIDCKAKNRDDTTVLFWLVRAASTPHYFSPNGVLSARDSLKKLLDSKYSGSTVPPEFLKDIGFVGIEHCGKDFLLYVADHYLPNLPGHKLRLDPYSPPYLDPYGRDTAYAGATQIFVQALNSGSSVALERLLPLDERPSSDIGLDSRFYVGGQEYIERVRRTYGSENSFFDYLHWLAAGVLLGRIADEDQLIKQLVGQVYLEYDAMQGPKKSVVNFKGDPSSANPYAGAYSRLALAMQDFYGAAHQHYTIERHKTGDYDYESDHLFVFWENNYLTSNSRVSPVSITLPRPVMASDSRTSLDPTSSTLLRYLRVERAILGLDSSLQKKEKVLPDDGRYIIISLAGALKTPKTRKESLVKLKQLVEGRQYLRILRAEAAALLAQYYLNMSPTLGDQIIRGGEVEGALGFGYYKLAMKLGQGAYLRQLPYAGEGYLRDPNKSLIRLKTAEHEKLLLTLAEARKFYADEIRQQSWVNDPADKQAGMLNLNRSLFFGLYWIFSSQVRASLAVNSKKMGPWSLAAYFSILSFPIQLVIYPFVYGIGKFIAAFAHKNLRNIGIRFLALAGGAGASYAVYIGLPLLISTLLPGVNLGVWLVVASVLTALLVSSALTAFSSMSLEAYLDELKINQIVAKQEADDCTPSQHIKTALLNFVEAVRQDLEGDLYRLPTQVKLDLESFKGAIQEANLDDLESLATSMTVVKDFEAFHDLCTRFSIEHPPSRVAAPTTGSSEGTPLMQRASGAGAGAGLGFIQPAAAQASVRVQPGSNAATASSTDSVVAPRSKG